MNLYTVTFVVLLILKVAGVSVGLSWAMVFFIPIGMWLATIIGGAVAAGMAAAYSTYKWEKTKKMMKDLRFK